MKYVSFRWRLLEAALSVLNFSLFPVLERTFEKELTNTEQISISAES